MPKKLSELTEATVVNSTDEFLTTQSGVSKRADAALITGAAGAVASVFSRTGAVVATAGDYDADKITVDDSGFTNISGVEVQAALDSIDALVGGGGVIVTSSAPDAVTKSAAVVGVSADAARADHKHDISTAAPASAGVGTSSGEGSATTLARSDHSHQSNTAPALLTKAAATIGTSTQPARADHKHDVSTAAAVELTDSTNAEGAATSLARSNHTHAHGTRGGGTLHADAIAAGAAGFMTGADKTKLDGIDAGAKVRMAVSTVSASTDSLSASDNNGHIKYTADYGCVVTVDVGTAGDSVLISRESEWGTVSFVGDSGVDIRCIEGPTPEIALRWGQATVTWHGTNTVFISGNLQP